LIICLFVLVSLASLRADVIDDSTALQNVFDEALLDIHGERWSPAIGESLQKARNQFAQVLTDPEAQELWNAPLPVSIEGLLPTVEALGFMQARLQHAAALEMISNQRAGNIDSAREWRSIIKLPKFANSVEGALALQRLGASPTQRAEVSRLLAKEYVIWQITRAREKADALARLIHEGRTTPALLCARAAEIQGLSNLPGSLLTLATGATPSSNLQSESDFVAFLAAARENSSAVPKVAAVWRLSLGAG
jgi:high-affinity iron transporter